MPASPPPESLPAPTEVEELLAAAANDPAAVPSFLTALLEATVIVPGTATDDGLATLADLRGPDGASVQPFYTSVERMGETLTAVPGFQTAYLGLPCRTFWEMTRGATLVLNPHSSHGKQFLPGEIGQLLDGAATLTPRVVPVATRVLVGQPAHVPPGMTEALSALFARHSEVDEAVLGWKVTPEGEAPGESSGSATPDAAGGGYRSPERRLDESYLLVVVGSSDARDALNPELGQALVTYSLSAPVDVQFVAPREGHLLDGIPPFYRRKRGFLRRR